MKPVLKALLTILFFAYVYLTFLYAFNGYPGFIQDSTCFLPTAYFINHYHQLINPLYDAGIDPIHHRFLFYPPLFPYTIAYILRLMPEFYNNIQISLTVIDFLSITVLFISLYFYVKKNQVQFSVLLYCFSIIWLLALFSFYGIQEGRPEVLCKFFIACFLLNNVYQSKRFLHFNNGLIIGLNLITSPVSTFYLMLINLGLLTYQNNFRLKPIVQTLLGFGIVLGCFTIVYPYHIAELLKGLQKHSQNVIVNRYAVDYFGNFIRFYITYAYSPFCIFNLLVAIGYIAFLLIRRNKIISLGILFILTIVISYFSFKDMPMNYNMLVLAPLCFFIIFVVFIEILKRKVNSFFLRASSFILIVILFVNSTGFIRKTLLFFNTQDNKVTYQDFRKEFIKVYDATPKDKKIAISFSLWPYCLDKYKSITLSNTQSYIQYEMDQQLYSGLSKPVPHAGFKLIHTDFISKKPKFEKIPLGNIYPWFQTAVYERK